MAILRDQLSDESAKTYGLVLAAADIAHRRVHSDEGWELHVGDESLREAEKEIQAFAAENPPIGETDGHGRIPGPLDFSAAWAILPLVTIHLAVHWNSNPKEIGAALGASAAQILQGQLYRCLTALLLHADSAHLLSNIAGLALFGSAVCAATGPGLGWFMITVAGALGNLINAWFYGSAHHSIGASTAVFGALGILVGLALINPKAPHSSPHKKWLLPLGGGLGLFAFLGMSPHTDFTAHAFGLLVGICLGLPYAKYQAYRPTPANQRFWAAFTALLLGISWVWGIVQAG